MAVPAAAQAQWEIEADPIAFALHGFSLHVARELPGGRQRLQIGVFGADVPASWLPRQFTERSRGITMKVDYFLGNRPAGVFIGVDGDYSREDYALKNAGNGTARNLFALGPRVGYRIDLGHHFYLTPWLSAGYQFNVHDDVVIFVQIMVSLVLVGVLARRKATGSTGVEVFGTPARFERRAEFADDVDFRQARSSSQ